MRSVRRCLGPTDVAPVAVVVWFTHRLVVPYALGGGAILAGTAVAVGVSSPASIAMLAMAGVAIGSLATTEYRIIAYAGAGVIILRSGRFRQVAKGTPEPVRLDAPVLRVSGNLVTSEWQVGDRVYTTYRRSDSVLLGISALTSTS